MTEPIITVEKLSYSYLDGTSALIDCSLAINRATKIAVLGANGAGKTTLFLHLNGLLRPTAGKLFFAAKPYDYSRTAMRELRSKIGLVFQNPDHQLLSACVREDVSFGPMNLGLPETEVRGRVEESLRAVGMLDAADKPVHNLSYGQKKRVCIAGVLAMKPDVIVLDEPMAGLDSIMQNELTDILDRLHDDGMTIIIATHDLDFAYSWAGQAIILKSGKVFADGLAVEVLQRSDVQEELGSKPFVSEICNSLSLIGIGLRDNGEPPRSVESLLQLIQLQAELHN